MCILYKRAAVLGLAAVCTASYASVVCYAETEPIELQRLGSVTFQITDNETKSPIDTGIFAIYRIAGAAEKDGGYLFQPTEEFQAFGSDFTDAATAEFADSAFAFIAENYLSSYASAELTDGVLYFRDLPVGLYLAVNTEAPKDYCKMKPFTFSIPEIEDGRAIYDIAAEPKPEIQKASQTTAPVLSIEETRTTESTTSVNPVDGDNDKKKIPFLPLTGDRFNLFMLLCGMGFSILGAWLFRKKRKKEAEKYHDR